MRQRDLENLLRDVWDGAKPIERCLVCHSDSRKEGNMVPCKDAWHTEAQPQAEPPGEVHPLGACIFEKRATLCDRCREFKAASHSYYEIPEPSTKAAPTVEEIARKYARTFTSLSDGTATLTVAKGKVLFYQDALSAINDATAALRQQLDDANIESDAEFKRAKTAEAAIEQVRLNLREWKRILQHPLSVADFQLLKRSVPRLLALLPPAPQATPAKEKP